MFRAKESAPCIVDDKGKIVRETKLPTDPEVIARFVAGIGLAIERIGLESGCTAAWLFAGLRIVGQKPRDPTTRRTVVWGRIVTQEYPMISIFRLIIPGTTHK
jgi:hypothetical protein